MKYLLFGLFFGLWFSAFLAMAFMPPLPETVSNRQRFTLTFTTFVLCFGAFLVGRYIYR